MIRLFNFDQSVQPGDKAFKNVVNVSMIRKEFLDDDFVTLSGLFELLNNSPIAIHARQVFASLCSATERLPHEAPRAAINVYFVRGIFYPNLSNGYM